jgi:hypothetical protein
MPRRKRGAIAGASQDTPPPSVDGSADEGEEQEPEVECAVDLEHAFIVLLGEHRLRGLLDASTPDPSLPVPPPARAGKAHEGKEGYGQTNAKKKHEHHSAFERELRKQFPNLPLSWLNVKAINNQARSMKRTAHRLTR